MSKSSLKERNKAIRKAWEREQELVSEGKGTRDWSQEQQKDILDPGKGKAYDENGRAFEGQHMKSAAEYPEYQDDPNNIQFLTREEHLEAHKGSWQNPTNWYYNPETKEFVDFGENKPIPCEAISLSEPLRNPTVDKRDNDDELKKPLKSEDNSTGHIQSSRQEDTSRHSENTSQNKAATTQPKVHESRGDKILHRVGYMVDSIEEFSEEHPVLTRVVKIGFKVVTAIAAVAFVASNSSGGSESSGDGESDYPSSSDSSDNYMGHSDRDDYSDPSISRYYPEERSSPEEHTVSAHRQRYHTKDGLIWKEKEPYQRGGGHDED